MGYSLRVCKESDTAEATYHAILLTQRFSKYLNKLQAVILTFVYMLMATLDLCLYHSYETYHVSGVLIYVTLSTISSFILDSITALEYCFHIVRTQNRKGTISFKLSCPKRLCLFIS